MTEHAKIVDPKSAEGARIIRNSAFEKPLTQGDPPPYDHTPFQPGELDAFLRAVDAVLLARQNESTDNTLTLLRQARTNIGRLRPASVPPAPQNEEVIEIDEDGRVLYPCGCRATPGAKPAPMHCPIHNRPASVPPAQENEEPEGHPQ